MRELLSPTENSAPSLPETSGNLCASLCNRGGEKNRLLINRDYNIDEVIFGLSYSVLMAVVVSVLMTNVEISRFPAAMALKSMLESVAILIGPPLAGKQTHTHSYMVHAVFWPW